ncbi:MAG: diadenylate cyclase [Deltaproteobacteria bacterium]|nr:diadenylate cyclase [Deltaproteobacteria bacterium]
MPLLDPVLAQVRDLTLADGLDIALVTVFFYSAIVLVRRTQARLVAAGVLVLVGLYIVARALDLRLTTGLLQGFFAVFLIMLVVIFQEELRQAFERLALWGLRRKLDRVPSYGTAEVLVACAADFARDHIGALIVLAGRQPIDRHLHGGVPLGGAVSEPLLKSLFDRHSPGHDGAVIISKDRVERFSTHLPLSTDFQQLRGVGTRHCAGLGLAERTDALCLIVSEERGGIAVAQQGQLRHLSGAAELEGVLHAFQRAVAPPTSSRSLIASALLENWAEKIASLVLVVGLWMLFVPGSRPATEAFPINVKVVNVPPGYELESIEPEQVTAILTGQRRNFYLFDPGRVDVTVDATLARYGRRTFAVSENQITHPSELTVDDVEPESVRLRFRRANGAGAPDAGDRSSEDVD